MSTFADHMKEDRIEFVILPTRKNNALAITVIALRSPFQIAGVVSPSVFLSEADYRDQMALARAFGHVGRESYESA